MANDDSNAAAATTKLDLPGHFDHVFIPAAELLRAMLKSIALAANGKCHEIEVMARHGSQIAEDLFGDLDVFCEDLKQRPA